MRIGTRVRYIPQMEAAECGAASLAMVLGYHGHHASIGEVREACGVSRDGASALQVLEAAEGYGLEVEAYRLEPQQLDRFRRPVILHWEMNHFVVLERLTRRGAQLVDPASGRRLVSRQELDRAFTGIVLDPAPGPRFSRRRRRRTSMRPLLDLLGSAPGAISIVLSASFCLSLLGLALPAALQVLVDDVLPAVRQHWLPVLAWALLGLVVMASLFRFLRAWILASLNAHLEHRMSEALIRHLVRLPIAFFHQRHTGDLMSRLQGAAVIRDLLTGGAVALLVDGAMLIAYLALMVVYDATLGALVAGAGLLYGGIFLATRSRQGLRVQTQQIEEAKQLSELVQIVRGMPTLKATGTEGARHNRWLNLLVNELNAALRTDALGARVSSGLAVVEAAVPVAVLAWGAQRVISGELTLGRLIGFQMLQLGFLLPLTELIALLIRAQSLPVLLERMGDVLGAAPEPSGERPCPLLQGRLTLEEVSFAYGSRSRTVLSEVSFEVAAGQKVALVGPSGSGKSTVARLLLGLYRPGSGRILVDGQDLAELDLASVRRQVGVVLQETHLFEGTIRENLSLYHPGAPLEDVVEAARTARIHEHVVSLPNGYDTPISASSGALSGGQRQRLALGRAILHRPPILVLDEATSALDPETEAAIEGYLTQRSCTRLVIAHRLSTVRDADLILVLDRGAIVERGRHRELVAAGGLYAELVAREGRSGEGEPRRREASAAGPEPMALERFRVLGELEAEERSRLEPMLERRSAAAGTPILERGDRAPGLLLLESGRADVLLGEAGLADWSVAELGPGDVLGESGLLDGSASRARVVAVEDCRLLLLPEERFGELRRHGDSLATRLAMAIGGVAASRLRQVTAQQQQVQAELPASEGESRSGAGARAEGPARSRALALEETPFGALFRREEIEQLRAMGEVRRVPAESVLIRAGDPSDAFLVLLGGRCSVEVDGRPINRVGPGQLIGEVGFFDRRERSVDCVTMEPSEVFLLPYESLDRLLDSTHRVAQKIVTHLALVTIRYRRIADQRLREMVARRDREEEAALLARERAFELEALHEGLADRQRPGRGGVPTIRDDDPRQSAAACLAAILYHHRRPVPLPSVREACATGGGATPRTVEYAARSFGLTFRQMRLRPETFRYLDAPLLVEVRGGRFAVADGCRGHRVDLMDPVAGRRRLGLGALADTVTGRCYELLPDRVRGPAASPLARLLAFVRDRRRVVVDLVTVTLLLQVMGLALPLLSGLVVQRVIPSADIGLLRLVAAALGAIVLIETVQGVVRSALLRYLRTHFDRDLLDQLMGQLLALPQRFFDTHQPGEIIQRFQSYRALRYLLTEDGIAALLQASVAAVAAIVLLGLDPRLGLLVLLVGLAHPLVTAACLLPIKRRTAAQLDADDRQQSRLLELLEGIVTLRLSGRRGGGAERWLPYLARQLAQLVEQERLAILATSSLDLLHRLALALVIGGGGAAVLGGRLGLGTFVAFYGLSRSFLIGLYEVAVRLVPFAHAVVHLERVGEVLGEAPEQDPEAAAPPGDLRGRITLEHVSFRYEHEGPLVLEDVSLDIEPGTKVAIVGSSGSGKTTLGKLLLGFEPPTRGRVLYDGRDLRSLDLRQLRRQLGVVLQDPYLFGTSIRENIAISEPTAGLDRVEEVARQAALAEDIALLPMKYDTLLGEGAATFSGGQRQRLALSRALLHRPRILLLDEATSALDNLSQSVVESSLAAMSCTRIVVAHRLSTVIDADRIVVLERGRIVETGRHEDLMERDGRYAELMGAQLP